MVICFFFFFHEDKKNLHHDYKSTCHWWTQWSISLQNIFRLCYSLVCASVSHRNSKTLVIDSFSYVELCFFLVLFVQVFLHHGLLNKYNKFAKIYTVEQFLMLELNFIIQSGKNLGIFFFFMKNKMTITLSYGFIF